MSSAWTSHTSARASRTPTPRSSARRSGSNRLGPSPRLQPQRAIRARGGFVESPELREDEALVHPSAAVRGINLEGTLVASERFFEFAEARERVSLVVPRDLVRRVNLDCRVEAAERVDEPTQFRERVPFVQPGDLVVRVDVECGVDRP